MTTAAAKELRQKYPSAQILVGDGKDQVTSPVFLNNPNINRLSEVREGGRVIWIPDYPGERPYIDKFKSTPTHRSYTTFQAKPGELFFTVEEIAHARELVQQLTPFVLIEPNVKGTWFGNNKDWGFDRYQDVVTGLKNQITFVQAGNRAQRSLWGVERVQTESFREACAILSFGALFLGPEGGLHHAAAALGKPAVVIYGGLISPATTGYSTHCNLYVSDHPLSPCGSLQDCEHCRECMDRITIDMVGMSTQNLLRATVAKRQACNQAKFLQCD